jgi:hypothetical protein
MWTDNQIKLLIKERRENNEYYWDLVGNGKMNFWDRVAVKINLEFGMNYSGKQCREKFQSLVRAYRVSKMQSIIIKTLTLTIS